jgi:hypothetical protein
MLMVSNMMSLVCIVKIKKLCQQDPPDTKMSDQWENLFSLDRLARFRQDLAVAPTVNEVVID